MQKLLNNSRSGLKILFLAHHEALGPRLLQEIKELSDAGHQAAALIWNFSGKEYHYKFPYTYIFSQNRESFKEGLKKSLFGAVGKVLGYLYPQTLKEVLTSSWDVVHCANLSLLPAAVIGKWLRGGKLVYDSYEFPTETIPAQIKNRTLTWFAKNVLEQSERFLLAWVDAVLTIPSINDEERKKFIKYCPTVQVMMNVPGLQGIYHNKDFQDPPSAIYSGGLNRNKGLYQMLEATAILRQSHPNFRLILVGHMLENPAGVEQNIIDLGIKDNVVIHSWVQPEKLEELLADAWIGLWLNQPGDQFRRITTGNSRKGFEYMKSGLPVVATSFGEIAKVVSEEQAGILVDATKPEDIAAAMNKIVENSAMRNKMSENGRSAVRNKYNWNIESKKLFWVYSKL
jgi:glycosyltransferase involved in cell wall biosynthesis